MNTLSTGAHVSRNRKATLLDSKDLRVNSVSARVFVTAPRMLIEEEETNYWLGNSFVPNVASVHVQLEETKDTLRAEIVASAIEGSSETQAVQANLNATTNFLVSELGKLQQKVEEYEPAPLEKYMVAQMVKLQQQVEEHESGCAPLEKLVIVGEDTSYDLTVVEGALTVSRVGMREGSEIVMSIS